MNTKMKVIVCSSILIGMVGCNSPEKATQSPAPLASSPEIATPAPAVLTAEEKAEEKLEALYIEAETLQSTIMEYVEKKNHGMIAVLRSDEVSFNIEVGGTLEKIIKESDLGSIFGAGEIKVNTLNNKWNQLGKLVGQFRVRMQRIQAIDEDGSRYQSLRKWAFVDFTGFGVHKTDSFDSESIQILPLGF